jgi:cysteine synthase A
VSAIDTRPGPTGTGHHQESRPSAGERKNRPSAGERKNRPSAGERRSRPIARSVEDLIGGTPLVRLALPEAAPGVTVLGKLEASNPLSSAKDRIGLAMILGAERRGDLVPGATIDEATSGNTGISLASLAAARGYGCILVMPDSATRERQQIVRALGGEVVLTPRDGGFAAAVDRAVELAREIPGAWLPFQHENPDNVRAH